MDFDDLNKRLARLYGAISARYEYDIESHVTEKTVSLGGGKFEYRISFGSDSDAEMQNKVMNAIHTIASLKDILKSKVRSAGGNSKDVEDLINHNLALALVIDLDNKDKHIKLTQTSRSGKNPTISNIQQGLSPTELGKPTSFSMGSTFDGNKSHVVEQKNVRIVVHGDIQDDAGHKIMDLEQLLNDSLNVIESFIKKANLI